MSVADSQFRKYFPVDEYAGFFKPVDKSAVRDIVFLARGVYPDYPQLAKITEAGPSFTGQLSHAPAQGFNSCPVKLGPASPETFCFLKNPLFSS